jgi:anaerobic selenocysteine-containing dehydrogenase
LIKTQSASSETWIPSTCDLCSSHCGITVKVVNGIAVKVEGNPNHPHNLGKLCAKGNSGLNYLYSPKRLTTPLKRTNPKKGIGIDPQWVEVTWDEALNEVVEKVKSAREKDPRLILIMSYDRTHEFGLISPIVAAIGTPNFLVGGAGYTCGNSFHPVSYMNHGTWYFEPDLELCNYLIIFGSQTGFLGGYSAMPTAMEMTDARSRGLKVVVFDPVCKTAASKADEWIPIRPATDGIVALGILNVILNELCKYDVNFLKRFTNSPYLVGPDGKYIRQDGVGKPLVWDTSEGRPRTFDSCSSEEVAIEGEFAVNGEKCTPGFQLVKMHVSKYNLDHVSEVSTVPKDVIRRIAQEYVAAANIGGTITLGGHSLPYRPAASVFERGTSGHTHGFLASWSINLLNTMIGNLDTPGGILGLNACGPWWSPTASSDGLLIPSKVSAAYYMPYPARQVTRPKGLELMELFPVAVYAQTTIPLATIEHERFGIEYVPEVMIHCRSNYLVSTADPTVMEEFAKKIPFIVSFQNKMEESALLADIVLPEAVYLERAPMPINTSFVGTKVGHNSSWYWGYIQPVVEPPPGVRDWTMVLLEIAKRAGFLKEIYKVLNEKSMREPYSLDLDKEYAWEEIIDRWLKSWAGEDRGIDYIRKTGFVEFSKKKIEETYWRYFKDIRAPLYLEHLLDAGKEVERMTKEMGVSWDVSDYQAVPDWKPCPAHLESNPQYDMFVVNYKTIQSSMSHTADSQLLDQINKRKREYDIVINSETARKKDINDGDKIVIETASGKKAIGKAKLAEIIHPEAVGIAGGFGHWSPGLEVAKDKGILWNALVEYDWSHIDHIDGALDMCIRARIYKE